MKQCRVGVPIRAATMRERYTVAPLPHGRGSDKVGWQ